MPITAGWLDKTINQVQNKPTASEEELRLTDTLAHSAAFFRLLALTADYPRSSAALIVFVAAFQTGKAAAEVEQLEGMMQEGRS
jgi:hypothetical protein